ncbi:hypothetical protein PsYK624_151500 [Phanerochaete sordida]|uniref:Deoxyribonuclease NucA/NucB domain-containing protein n=1 Tax=Phanerochaete sordida TaxID=48140 RepID=A0A9P3GN94_9APHY|nr:hypothetical protein PsYK624_151500 [Phanerochaete sordida]
MFGTYLTASFALLAVWCAAAHASPTGSEAPDGLTRAPNFNETVEILANGALAPALGPPYVINCAAYPNGYANVCENWCYYAFCHQKAQDKNANAWIVTVDRAAANRAKSACGLKPANKCSIKGTGKPWPPAPVKDLSCDEQPKNTNSEGGPNAATRCMPAKENSGEGAKWSNWINYGPQGKLADKTQLRVVLQNPPSAGFCRSWYTPGAIICVAPVTPQGSAGDAIRQQ